jgi:hypothetical protein
MMTAERKTVQQFVKENGITMTCRRVDRNPNMDGSDRMDNWRCRLRGGREMATRMSVYFSMGYGHNGAEPKPADVLGCLASDASTIGNASDFESWCSELGYDPDSRKAEKTYRVTLAQSAKLEAFLGSDLYETLVWNTEAM